MKTLYTAIAIAEGGREGKTQSLDGSLVHDLKPPKELGGPGTGTNPEELLAHGWAACFQNAMHTLAKIQKKEIADSSVTCEISLNLDDGASVSLSARMLVTIPDLPEDEARALVEHTHKVCPFSKATEGNIPVELVIE
jgi:lipoyl-dependent peroxiredoxin